MTTTRRTIRLAHLINGHRDEVKRIADDHSDDTCWALSPDDVKYPPIVRQVDRDQGQSATVGFAIVDGFHRFSRMLASGATEFPVIVVDAPKEFLRSIDADSEIGNCEPLDAIYEAAGL